MTKTARPSTISQTSGGKFQTFSNLNNIKKDTDYAECLVHGKTQPLNRPATITCSNFKANLPTGATVTQINVELKHSKAAYNNKECNVPAPSVSLLNGSKVLTYRKKTTQQNIKVWNKKTGKWEYKKATVAAKMTKKANAPTSKGVVSKVVFKNPWNYDEINTSNFGVKIDYPTNTNSNEGYIRLYYVKIIISYRTADFTVKINQVSGEYNGDQYELMVNCSNKNNVNYIPTITIDAPEGFSYNKAVTLGTFTKVSNRTFRWKPKLGWNRGSDTLIISFDSSVTFSSNQDSATGTFNAVESLANHSSSKKVTILKNRPVDPVVNTESESDEKTITDEQADKTTFEIVYLKTFQVFDFDLDLPEDIEQFKLYCCTVTDGNFSDYDLSNLSAVLEHRGTFGRKGSIVITTESYHGFSIATMGAYTLVITPNDSDEILKVAYVDVRPHFLSEGMPYISIVKLSDEETNRLGDGYVYTAQTFMKILSGESYVRKWDENFRIGVFNNRLLREATFQNNGNLSFNYDSGRALLSGYFALLEGISEYEVSYSEPVYHNGELLQKATLPLENFTIEMADASTVDMTLNLINEEDDEIFESYFLRLHLDSNDVVKTLYEPTTADDYTIDEIHDNMEYWSDTPSQTNEFENLECRFPYNKDYPVFIVVTGDYAVKNMPIEFTEPCVIEDYTDHKKNGVYPTPILDSIGDDTFSEINISEVANSDTIVFYDFPFTEDNLNEDIVIRGFAIEGNVDSNTDDLILNTKLVNGENESKNRSIMLDENNPQNYEDNYFTIGQVGDLFGFKTSELGDMGDWEIHFSLSNVLNEFVAQAQFGGISLVVYTERVINQTQKCVVEDEDLSCYGALIQNVKIPSGLNTDLSSIQILGSDVEDFYHQKIVNKTIELEFVIHGCDMDALTLSLREVTRVLTTRRDKYKRPIPKRIEFSHYPDVFWEYVMEDAIDSEYDNGKYNCKAKLVIPAGTSYDKNPTSTSNTGYVSGLTAVKPIIQFSPTENIVSIRELFSEQEFNMGYEGDWLGKIIEIDCEDRFVWLKNSEDDDDPIDISSDVDINSDWFMLEEEYEFETVGCAIRSVDWQERW